MYGHTIHNPSANQTISYHPQNDGINLVDNPRKEDERPITDFTWNAVDLIEGIQATHLGLGWAVDIRQLLQQLGLHLNRHLRLPRIQIMEFVGICPKVIKLEASVVRIRILVVRQPIVAPYESEGDGVSGAFTELVLASMA